MADIHIDSMRQIADSVTDVTTTTSTSSSSSTSTATPDASGNRVFSVAKGNATVLVSLHLATFPASAPSITTRGGFCLQLEGRKWCPTTRLLGEEVQVAFLRLRELCCAAFSLDGCADVDSAVLVAAVDGLRDDDAAVALLKEPSAAELRMAFIKGSNALPWSPNRPPPQSQSQPPTPSTASQASASTSNPITATRTNGTHGAILALANELETTANAINTLAHDAAGSGDSDGGDGEGGDGVDPAVAGNAAVLGSRRALEAAFKRQSDEAELAAGEVEEQLLALKGGSANAVEELLAAAFTHYKALHNAELRRRMTATAF